jgi:sarcosine oxidase, subunit gamma
MPSPLPMRHKLLLVGPPEALAAALGPLSPNTTRDVAALGTLLWLRPEQWLLVSGGDVRGELETRLAEPADVLDVGARFLEFAVTGPAAVDILASGCSLDFRPKAFGPGQCAQSRIEQVPVILHREAFDRFVVFVERPLARYLSSWLELAAADTAAGSADGV